METVQQQLDTLLDDVRSLVSDVVSEALPDGFARNYPEARTELHIRATNPEANVGEPMGVAEVVTRVWDPDFARLDRWGAARANRWSMYGALRLTTPGVFEVRCSISVFFGGEDGWRTYGDLLADAFRKQAAMAIGAVCCVLDESSFEKWQRDCGGPREWQAPPQQVEFERVVEVNRRLGVRASTDGRAAVFDVPLHAGGPAAFVRVSAHTRHPLGGAGWSGTIALPVKPGDCAREWADFLNAAEPSDGDYVPRIGAWGANQESGEVVYSMFLPARLTQGRPGAPAAMVAAWLIERVRWFAASQWKTFQHGPPSDQGPTVTPEDLPKRAIALACEALDKREEKWRHHGDVVQVATRYGVVELTASAEDGEPVVRTTLALSKEISDLEPFQRARHRLNSMAALGALVRVKDRCWIATRAVLRERSWRAATLLSVTAAIHGARAICEGVRRTVEPEDDASQENETSAWTELDLERLAYEHGHLLGAKVGRAWIFAASNPRGVWNFECRAIDSQPVLGGGLLCTGVFNAFEKRGDEEDEASTQGLMDDLNGMSFASASSFFGGWCAAPGTSKFAYVVFLPNELKSVRITNYIVAEMLSITAEAHAWVNQVAAEVQKRG